LLGSTPLLIADDHLRRSLAQFKPVAHLLDLRSLLFETCNDRFNFLLLLRESGLKVLPQLRDSFFNPAEDASKRRMT
jgi:hypothetical protein